MRARKAEPKDLRIVFGDLAERCLSEIRDAGYSVSQAKDVFRRLQKDGNLWALVAGDETIGLIGFEHDDDQQEPAMATFFLGREAFFDPSIRSASFGRRFMREIQAGFGNRAMISVCFGTHPEIARWYRLMGYRLDETHEYYRVFKLDPMN